MKKKNFKVLLTMIFFITLLAATQLMASDAVENAKAANALKYGFLTLIPPLTAIVLAFITKNVITSLFLGVLSGTFMLALNDNNVFASIYVAFEKFTYAALGSLADSWNAGIVLQVLTIGGLIALISKLGGAKAVAESLAKHAKTAKSSQLITWVLGLFIFFDDYANSLIVGPIMRPVTDKQNVSREKLSFIIDATAAPIAGIMFVSTWIGYELSVIKDGFGQIGQEISPFNVFIETIPFRFYNILMLLFVVFLVVTLRDFGPMYQAEKRARLTGKVIKDGAVPLIGNELDELVPKSNVKLSIWNAIIPIGSLIIGSLLLFYFNGRGAILGGDDAEMIAILQNSPLSFVAVRESFGASDAAIVLFQAALIASIVTIVMGLIQKAWTLKESLDIWVMGMKSLLITGVILILAWSLSGVIKELGTAHFLSNFLEGAIPQFLLPSLIFIFACIISFATGTSYGTMGILMPLTIPIAHQIGGGSYELIIFSISAVLSGAILGDHSSPISDTTILSSMGAACDHLDHVNTQLPYALTIGALSILVGYLPLGLGLPIYIVLPVAILVTFLIVRFVGKRVDTPEATK
ncbi:Na+/H+ antiporter NhaC family protein [Cellulosilyticum sp. I15G10I2]|uniref:Na+/H+ antiporter NhaC family protein n=1 Tax=Cellulosilyticum sp. I15G10I2 TaxID=1892843 RepID=UPI00085C1C1A|nr:Na+/H+ antiporter NhaC family protein [Cellulosilyticum sp. I15G10I2]